MKQIGDTIYFRKKIFFDILANYDLDSLVDNKDLKPNDLPTNNFKKETNKRRFKLALVIMLFVFIIIGLVLLIIGLVHQVSNLNKEFKFVVTWPEYYKNLFRAGLILMVSSAAITLSIIIFSYIIYHFKLKKMMQKVKNMQDIGYLKKDQNIYPYILQWPIKVFFKKNIDKWNNAEKVFKMNRELLNVESLMPHSILLPNSISDATFKKYPGFYGSSQGAYLGVCILFDKINGLNFAYRAKN